VINLLRKLLSMPIVRYLIMAVVIVGIEVGVFWVMNSQLRISYLIATPASMAVGIVLNWYFSRVLVFKVSVYSKRAEFLMVLAASLVGVGIQLVVTAFVVEILRLLPLIGKLAAICVTFFWNFWIRRAFIFRTRKSIQAEGKDDTHNLVD
jgi:putative flippase GtrA